MTNTEVIESIAHALEALEAANVALMRADRKLMLAAAKSDTDPIDYADDLIDLSMMVGRDQCSIATTVKIIADALRSVREGREI